MENRIQSWENALAKISLDDKLVLAHTLIRNLGLTTSAMNISDKDGSIKLIAILDHYIRNVENKQEIMATLEVLTRFLKLSLVGQQEVVSFFATTIAEKAEQELQAEKEAYCCENGHSYGSWEKHTRVTPEVYWLRESPHGTMNAYNITWTRECTHCGYTEKTEIEPKELQEKILLLTNN